MKINRKIWFKTLLAEIETKVNKFGNVSICTGNLNELELNKLQGLYEVEKGYFGYIKFTKKSVK